MKVLLTGGPTREYLDPVRYITNRSSGKMAKALIGVLLKRKHKVTAVLGPCGVKCPKSVKTVNVETARQMKNSVMKEAEHADAVIMCAAVADYTPVKVSAVKIKKSDDILRVRMKRTPDILFCLGRKYGKKKVIAGFAAETDKIEENALRKLRDKKCDMIVANKVGEKGAGFDSSMMNAALFFREGGKNHFGKISKNRLGYIIVREIERLRQTKNK
ncbi:MAG: phosphopantothenoylcysteine decarboxylase [bacterium]|nr:phosphopantothenoylcysteine decarboxylase [bacterium]